jgi:hypothetical protein
MDLNYIFHAIKRKRKGKIEKKKIRIERGGIRNEE